MEILVLGLGNELLCDDGVGILAARALRDELDGIADVVETSLHGLALLELFLGYRRAVLIDAIHTATRPAGAIVELDPGELATVASPSPHYTGLPEMLTLAAQLELDFPGEIHIIAMEVADPHTIGGELTPAVRQALPELVARVRERVGTLACSG